MENAMLIGLSQQTALRRQMDVIANNLANMNTSGFKGEKLMFEEYVMPVARDNNWRPGSDKLSYVHDARLLRDFSEGPMRRTDNPLDVAINGSGWFVVQTENGERFTRNGHFKLDAQGQLVTSTGALVLNRDGPIIFDPDETGITISQDGQISTSKGDKGQLRIVEFENEHRMKKEGASLFSSPDDPRQKENPRMVQGMIESSNVNPVMEMTRMIEVQRAYTRASSMLEKENELLRETINKLGRAPN